MCWVCIPHPVGDIFHQLSCSGTDEWCVSLRWTSASKLSARPTGVGIPKQQASVLWHYLACSASMNFTQPTWVRVWVRKGCHTPSQYLRTFANQSWGLLLLCLWLMAAMHVCSEPEECERKWLAIPRDEIWKTRGDKIIEKFNKFFHVFCRSPVSCRHAG